jgi:hypothetical protein
MAPSAGRAGSLGQRRTGRIVSVVSEAADAAFVGRYGPVLPSITMPVMPTDGRLGGMRDKHRRRFGLPCVWAVAAYSSSHPGLALSARSAAPASTT